jgi:hypothetical protein
MMFLWAQPAVADWVPADGHKMHFPQMPDESGWDVKAMSPNMLADDWQCSKTGLVRDLHFWGSWKNGVTGNIKKFDIVIFEDIPANPPGLPFSRPGSIIWRFPATNYVAKTITAPTMEGWYDPSTNTFTPNDHQTYYQYNIFLTPQQWFHQDSGKIYWLGISADVEPGAAQPEWGWKSTKDHWNDDAVWGPIPTGGITCVADDNGTGTASQPSLCRYIPLDEFMRIKEGLPAGDTIKIETELVALSMTSESPGGGLGGTSSQSQMQLEWHMMGTGSLSGLVRNVVIPVQCFTHQGPRVPGTSPQSFPTDLFGLQGQLPIGDPDFDLLRITAGTGFGMPSPGHTTLTTLPGGNWNVESFFDITYRIDFVGHPGGPLSGRSGSTTATIRLSQGAPATTWTDIHEPQVILPPIQNIYQVAVDPNGQFAGGNGTDAYGQGWYTYPSQWINVWFYDHPFDISRFKKIHIEFDLAPFSPTAPSIIEFAVNWSTNIWSISGNPPGPRRPPLPGENEEAYIGRATLLQQTTPTGHHVFDFIIPDYNPEWVSIDVRGRNFVIPTGVIIHECLPKNPPPSLDLSFVITNGGALLGACCLPGGLCQQLTAAACQTAAGVYLGDGTSCTPNPCTPTGACCIKNATGTTCQILSAGDCATAGGTYIGNGTSCTPDPCISPTGACCIPGIPCQIMTATDCQSHGGSYMGNNSTCSPNPCLPPRGACCLPSGGCVMVPAAQCAQYGGVYMGDYVPCSQIQCGGTGGEGACCLPTGQCVYTTPSKCQDIGGTFAGAGVPCTAVNCVGTTPRGACCMPNGNCVFVTAADCQSHGGTYKGDNVPCATAQCSGVPKGACCVQGAAGITCLEISAAECEILGGHYFGDGIACATVDCFPPRGACCIPGAGCQMLTAAQCAQQNGIYKGDNVPCSPDICTGSAIGACCLPTGNCVIATAVDCIKHGGVYQGDNTTCANADCPPAKKGACCLPSGQCVETIQDLCVHSGGIYLGDGTTCLPPTSCGEPTGACCLPNGLCITTTAIKCKEQHGIYGGHGTSCVAGQPCPPDESGACCLPDGTCIQATPLICYGKRGIFYGTGTTCGSPGILCPTPSVGACCLRGGGCVQITMDSCKRVYGTYFGPGSACSPTLCPPVKEGACCLPDGTCIQTIKLKCRQLQGTFQGPGSSCALVRCKPPSKGACCLQNGVCVVTTVAECKLAHGAWQGNGTSCTPNPCKPLRGACCLPTGGCVVIAQADCLAHGGIYKGDNVPCLATTCAPIGQTGACCLPNGGGCIQSTAADCAALGGTSFTLGTPCTATSCPPRTAKPMASAVGTTGCCCLPEGACVTTTKDICDLADGVYAGDGVLCSGTLSGTPCCVGSSGNIDCDPDGGVDISDLSSLIDGLYISLTEICCDQAADVDKDGNVDISDLSALIDRLYINFTPLQMCP